MSTRLFEATFGDDAEDTTFQFLDLPAEIRNNIYEKAIEDCPEAYLKSARGCRLASRSALPRVNHQVREEFLTILYLFADIIAKVNDYDFGHVITFLNHLCEAELKALPSVGTQTQRRMLIVLDIVGSDMKALARWLNRVRHPTKKGAHVSISYAVDLGRRECLYYAQRLEEEKTRFFFNKNHEGLQKIIEAFEQAPNRSFSWPERGLKRHKVYAGLNLSAIPYD